MTLMHVSMHAGTANFSSARSPADYSTNDSGVRGHSGRTDRSQSRAVFTIEPDALWDSIMEASMMDSCAFESPRASAMDPPDSVATGASFLQFDYTQLVHIMAAHNSSRQLKAC